MNDDNNINLKNSALGRAYKLKDMSSSEGWAEIIGFITESIQGFSNRALNEGFKDMETYQLERGKVLGLTSLVAEITTAIDFVEREKTAEKDAGGTGE